MQKANSELTMYLSLLRGINVGGKNTIRMAELTALYESLGFTDVKTYLQSGNVIFSSGENSAEKLAGLISEEIERVLGLDIVVLQRTISEWFQVISYNPFLTEEGIDSSKLHVTFLAGSLPHSAMNSLSENSNNVDRFVIRNKEIFLYCPGGYGKTRFNNTYFEKKTGISATTRNWRTVTSLKEMVEIPGVQE